MNSASNENYCLNCAETFKDQRFSETEVFCSFCGQSNRDSKLSAIRLFKDALSNIFNLDSRLIHTFRDIYRPAKLSQAYTSGKRKYYVNPARLFIFTLIGVITIALWLLNTDDIHFSNTEIEGRVEQSNLLDHYNSLIDTLDYQGDKIIFDTIRKKLFDGIKTVEEDTLGIGEAVKLGTWNADISEYKITAFDAVHLAKPQIYKKYEVEGFWNKVKVSQYIRIITNPSGSLVFILKNLTWAVFLSIIFVSIFLKIYYIRKRFYLVEHIVFLLNLNSFFFITIGIILAINTFVYSVLSYYNGDYDVYYIVIPILFAIGVQFMAIKKYYSHGIFMTLISQLIINMAYLTIFGLSTILIAIISLLLY